MNFVGSYIDEGYKRIESKYADFFRLYDSSIEQYVTIGKKSEKFAPLELEVLISDLLPENIKSEIENLYKPIIR